MNLFPAKQHLLHHLCHDKQLKGMPHGPTYFETKGRCIYCGIVSDNLSDEHIVPKALGGQHVIRKASCKKCADITSKFERKIARDLWGDARIAFNAPSYRKNNRPTHFKVSGETKEIAVQEYPAGFVFYKMGKSGFMQGLAETEDISSKWKLVMIDDDVRRKSYFKKHGRYPTLKFRHVPQEFARMIAKIGYGQILTIFHPAEFSHICLPYILGSKSNVSFIVGGGEEDVKPIPDIGYSLNTECSVTKNHDRLLLVAKVRIYANTHSPEYSVVVGEFIGKESVANAARKLSEGIISTH